MNNNLDYRFSQHDHLAHETINGFVADVVCSITNVSSGEKMVAVSWCHLMATLVASTFPFVRVVDGAWFKDHQHSWVETKYTKHIIDVSPVGCIGSAILYPGKPLKKQKIYWRLMFTTPKEYVDDIKRIRESKKFQTALANILKQTKKQQKRWKKFYDDMCKEHKVKPYKRVRLFIFDILKIKCRVKKKLFLCLEIMLSMYFTSKKFSLRLLKR